MTFDEERAVTVLFGGLTTSTVLADTWEWNGQAWNQRAIAGPPARSEHQMAYDAARAMVVLFGGRNQSGDRLDDTWEYDGATWRQSRARGPAARSGHPMAFDAVRAEVVLFGGVSSPGTTWPNDTHVYAPGPAPAPAIYLQPQDRVAIGGDSVTFEVAAEGTGELRYQWYHDGAAIEGAESATLTIDAAAPADAGVYVVVVSDLCLMTTSREATLVLRTPADCSARGLVGAPAHRARCSSWNASRATMPGPTPSRLPTAAQPWRAPPRRCR
jgi:hypothetical protein